MIYQAKKHKTVLNISKFLAFKGEFTNILYKKTVR